MSAHPLAVALERGLRSIKLELPAEAQAQLLRYLDEMSRWNSAYNLTAIRAPGDMVIRHLLDSLVLLPVLQALAGFPQLRLLDVGAGAGLPGIPLAIAAPQLAVTVLDSNGKKARFMRHVQRTLALANVEVAEARVEAHAPAAPYELIVSRAFASLADFFTASRSLLAAGGVWVAMKGKLDAAELAAVPAAVDIRETRRLRVPGLDEERHAVVAHLKP
ncbi:16S rRNA (guanine(527)-N(7))-methyltransferase RsmG [Solimonas terrae]|uniref:Ribosomal RNA small subunit methyltransferase G n=1 Tax=Solimonas terrae TaxID=1396819 RepID=A0A6M2BTT7_9GAMM|nr:16S rRNA (guanine(527)-N(7))-methyltransferase RsmG [Solimonas terrae]NGY05645.1 16S rRNA (guanine(527)-N(7))-methyltransferase RsmG [Solimonas terrae]